MKLINMGDFFKLAEAMTELKMMCEIGALREAAEKAMRPDDIGLAAPDENGFARFAEPDSS